METNTETAAEGSTLHWLRTAVAGLGGSRRPGQEQMAVAVQEAIDSGRHLLVQAGTGTGKSLAYLVPAIRHVLNSEQPVVVTTATLALQNQVMKRDIPRLLEHLSEVLPRPVDVVLVKGRSNYVCKNKIAGGFPDDDSQQELIELPASDATTTQGMTPQAKTLAAGQISDLGEEVLRVRAWAETTETGDRDDLIPGVSDRAWRQVSVTARECLSSKCRFYEECFVERNRSDAAEADLVITNHALLAYSALEGHNILPEFEVVVVDEGHELQDRITSSMAAELSVAMITAAVNSTRKHTPSSPEGLAEAADSFAAAFNLAPDGLLERGLNEAQETAITEISQAARALLSQLQKKQGSGGEESSVDAGTQLARARLQEIYDAALRVLDAAAGVNPRPSSGQQGAREALWLTRPRTYTPGRGYHHVEENASPQLWVAPISVAWALREKLFAEHTVVMTSATLALGSSFKALASAVGLAGAEGQDYSAIDVGSPFDYASQGILYAAKHLPPPARERSPEHMAEIKDLITASGGGALGLFASRAAAKEAAEYLREELSFTIYCQGEGATTAELIQRFAQERDSCLFGTMTLWQGVDVPGEALRLVVVDKLPFPRLDDPIAKARSMRISRNGGNGFLQVSATHAAILLAQGVGRLIRSQEDRGVVAILDSRLVNQRYGGYIKSALPPLWSTWDKTTVLQALQRLKPED